MSLAIIGGTAKGRKLVTLAGDNTTRPTAAKVRAALFNILVAWTRDNAWLDLYAGSGAVGLEALSRGAARAVLVEKNAQALAVVRQNVALTKLKAEVRPQDALAAIRQLEGQVFDVVFLDPPYAQDPVPTIAAAAGLVADDGRLVVEHHAERALPEAIGPLRLRETRLYAETALTFYGRGGGEAAI